MKTHPVIEIKTDIGTTVKAQAPIIISASRSTDIPAFYIDWFFNRLMKGYVCWRNPFNGKDTYVSFANTRFIVFWSKNPAPLLPYIPLLKKLGIRCYIQYTINDYGKFDLETNVPDLNSRIKIFKELVNALGPGSVIWRFDPLILTREINTDTLLSSITNIGSQLNGYTEKLVFSFADISDYSFVAKSLTQANVSYYEWDPELMTDFASRISHINHNMWNYSLATCSEKIDFSEFGIEHNRCIDPELIMRLSEQDQLLMNFVYFAKHDQGQRKHCGCILSKDIGHYNTCIHGCKYCYATRSARSAMENFLKHKQNPFSESII